MTSRLPLGPWTWWRRVAVAVMAVAMTVLVPMVATLVIPPSLTEGGPRALIEKSLLLALPVLVALPLVRPMTRRDLGIRGTSWSAFALWAVGGAVVLNVASAVWDRVFDSRPMGEQLVELGFGRSAVNSLALIASIVVIAPVAEEFLFRAFLHRGARDALLRFAPRWLASTLATAVSSTVFMQIHGDPDQQKLALLYLLFGALTAAAYEFTGSLYAPVFLHAATNAYAVAHGSLDGSAPGLASPLIVGGAIVAPVVALGLTWVMGRAFPAARR